MYFPGQRRVRRLPAFEYDNPIPGYETLETADQYPMFAGARPLRLEAGRQAGDVHPLQQLRFVAKRPVRESMAASIPPATSCATGCARVWKVKPPSKGAPHDVRQARLLHRRGHLDDYWPPTSTTPVGKLWRVMEASIYLAVELGACVSQEFMSWDLTVTIATAEKTRPRKPSPPTGWPEPRAVSIPSASNRRTASGRRPLILSRHNGNSNEYDKVLQEPRWPWLSPPSAATSPPRPTPSVRPGQRRFRKLRLDDFLRRPAPHAVAEQEHDRQRQRWQRADHRPPWGTRQWPRPGKGSATPDFNYTNVDDGTLNHKKGDIVSTRRSRVLRTFLSERGTGRPGKIRLVLGLRGHSYRPTPLHSEAKNALKQDVSLFGISLGFQCFQAWRQLRQVQIWQPGYQLG